MCGIVGAVRRDGAVDERVVRCGCDAMTHRGPDDAGLWRSADGRVVLAHRRLAILDLSHGGHQPMASPDGALHVAFNGEIYNFADLRDELGGDGFSFATHSDTEVLLAAYQAWGTACVTRLRGMFAFALHDARRGVLFLARDRAGEKPLFYRHGDGAFACASELKALLADPAMPRRLDPEALNHYLAYGFVPGARCILRGVHKLPPAHCLELDIARDMVRTWRYWDLPAATQAVDADPEALVDRLDALLEGSVRRQLVADVPVGVLLSGGIDSSLVAAMAARVSPRPVRTFTVSFPGAGAYDEGPYARRVAEWLGTDHTELVAEPTSVELLPRLARQYDEPLADSSMVPTFLVSQVIRQHATVALGGDGGDELFGGYWLYGLMLQQQAVRRWIPRTARRAVGALARATMPVGARGRNHVLGYTGDFAESFSWVNLFFDRGDRRALLAPLGEAWVAGRPEEFRARESASGATPLQQMTSADFRTYLPDDILVKVDRASMLTSLEVRAPFLDHELIEFAFGEVPDHLRATTREKKILPRRLAARLLPPDLDLTRKQGFSLPLGEWFRGPWGAFFDEVLSGIPRELFDQRVIQSLLAGQRRGLRNAHRLFALTMFELWRREYGVTA
jgi:asparagine synthase (glutamine-hydrolysing)